MIIFALAACAGRKTLSAAPATLVIVNTTVVDVVAGVLKRDSVVVISGSRIRTVGPAAAVAVPSGARMLDGRGLYVIPGLWDMHVHALWSESAMQSFLPLFTSQGVTGVRDMGGRMDVLARYRASLDGGVVPWPRVVAAGQILDGPEPVQAEISIGVATAPAAVAAVEELKRDGADFIKVYTLLGREPYFAALAHARSLGLPVAGHVPAEVTVQEAAVGGQRSIEHLRDEIEPFCSPAQPKACAQIAAIFRKHQTWQVPTLVALHAKAHFDDPALESDPRLRYLPDGLRKEWLGERAGKLGRGADYLARKRAWFADEAWLARYLVEQEVPMLAGSDAGIGFSYPGFSLHRELELLVEAGMTPLQALRAATLSPAQFFGERDLMGSVEQGRAADLVLLRANPLLDIRATQQIEAVVLRGRLLDRAYLDRVLADAASKNP